MRNKYGKIIILIVIILFKFNVKANNINKIDMDVFIDSNGNASITETWYAYLTQGTEGYRSYSKLDGSEMYNLSVTDESGRIYQILNTWNSNDSFSNKSYKAALVNKGNESELCFGISSYGNKVYTIKYNVSSVVRNYSDVQGIYYSFLQMDLEVSNVKITIHSDIPFSLDNARIWGLGYKGDINFSNGSIVLTTNKGLYPGNRMVALVRFNERVFDTNLTISKSFDNIYDEALANVKMSNSSNEVNSMLIILILIFGGIFIIIPLLLFFVVRRLLSNITFKDYSKGNHGKYLDFGKNGKKLPKEVPYWREIPCYKSINYAYWLCDEFYLVKTDTLIKGIIGAYLLKWFNNDIIKIINNNGKYSIDVSSELVSNDSVEKVLYYIITEASGDDKVLEPEEFKKWSRVNYDTLYNLGNVVNSYIINYLTIKGDLIRKSSNTAFDFEIKDSIREEAIKVKGFIKYLNDFSLIREKEHIEVKLWNEYLIFAELFGVADKVREEFKKLYPDMHDVNERILLDKIYLFDNIASDISTACITGARIGYNRNIFSSVSNSSRDYSGSSSSSGGGGSSFSSGGGSASGSSGGGFR